jgi:hypothetical protein
MAALPQDWQLGTVIEGNSEYGYDSSGTRYLLRRRNLDGTWNRTAAGASYYARYPSRFIISAPCLGYWVNENGYKPSRGNLQFQHTRSIPLTEETILEMSQDPRLHGVLNAAIVTDDAAFDNMIREILRTTPLIQVEETDGSTRQRHVIYEYNITWCWNEDEPLVHP